MATIQRFDDFDAWRLARDLTRDIYAVTREDAFRRDFGLSDQIRRAGVSIMANVAEGFERSGTGEFIQFLGMAKGSTGEVRSHLYVALDQQYIGEETFRRLYDSATQDARLISSLMSYLRRSGIKGYKYKSL